MNISVSFQRLFSNKKPAALSGAAGFFVENSSNICYTHIERYDADVREGIAMKKIWKKVLIIILAVLVSIPVIIFPLAVAFPFTALIMNEIIEELSFDPASVQQPKTTYGEFPFSLVYEIDGERVEIKDTLVIEYEGCEKEFDRIEYKWNAYYKNSIPDERYAEYSKSIHICKGEIAGLIGPVRVNFFIGHCEDYMGLPEPYPNVYEKMNPGDIYISYYVKDERLHNNLGNAERLITEEELYEYFNIRIIEKTVSDPIT